MVDCNACTSIGALSTICVLVQVPDWGDALNLQIYSETRNGRESKEHVDSLLKNTWHETEEIKEETVTALPSTLFFGVRGQQVATEQDMHYCPHCSQQPGLEYLVVCSSLTAWSFFLQFD